MSRRCLPGVLAVDGSLDSFRHLTSLQRLDGVLKLLFEKDLQSAKTIVLVNRFDESTWLDVNGSMSVSHA